MDTIKSKEKTEINQKLIKELFRERSTDELYNTWADTFEIRSDDDNQVLIYYFGEEDIKLFKDECRITLLSCIYSVMGNEKKIRIIKKSGYHSLSPKAKKNITALKFFVIGMIFVCIATAIIVVMCNYIDNRDFRETFHNTSSIKVDSRVRVVQISDLHGSSYSKDNKDLLERVKALEPDIILCTGDIVNSVKDDLQYAVDLAKALSGIAPSYYIYGNNEVEGIYDIPLNEKELDAKFGFNSSNRDETALLKLTDTFEDQLENAGIKVLKNEKDTLEVKNMTVDVYGVLTSNPSSFWSYTEKSFADYIYEDTDNLKITAVHEPFIFEEFSPEYWGDLIVCGHTHGGVMRVPVLGPLYTHEGGLFPERSGDFIYGRYDAAGTPLIVSGGLENKNILRINNQPELVIIDINKF